MTLPPRRSGASLRTILLVDEVPMLRELGALFLSRVGHVVTAGSGAEALEAARRLRPDLVVLNLRLPDLDGAEVCRRMKADPRLAKVPVVVLSASESRSDRERVVRAGADEVLPKPIRRADLLAAAKRFLDFVVPRGQPRIALDTPVRLRRGSRESWGIARNLSRGGLFVECARPEPPRTELALSMRLPERARVIDSTAQVVWVRPAGNEQRAGMGLRFLALDGKTARSLDEYLQERIPVAAERLAPGARV